MTQLKNKCLCICHVGFEDICKKEISELINIDSTTVESGVIFEFEKIDQLQKLCYLSQSIIRVVILFDSFSYTNSSDIIKKIEKIDASVFKRWLTKESFAARCLFDEFSNISSLELEKEIGRIVIEKTGIKVELDSPKMMVGLFLQSDVAYIGLDYASIDLSKRSYKIYQSPKSLKGTLAYSIIRHTGYDKKNITVDPFSNNGVLAIEAALFASGFPVRFYDKEKFAFGQELTAFDTKPKKPDSEFIAFDPVLANVEKTKKNAKIAGVDKWIRVAKVETEWLDTKLDEESVDLVITHIPEISKRTDKRFIVKLYEEFFYHAEFFMKKKGKIFALMHNGEEFISAAKKNNFSLVSEKDVYSGKDRLVLVCVKKSSA